jgi:hypothetical protein
MSVRACFQFQFFGHAHNVRRPTLEHIILNIVNEKFPVLAVHMPVRHTLGTHDGCV